MKRGGILIAVLVAMAALSLFLTGLHAGFLDTITGNSFSLITGNFINFNLPLPTQAKGAGQSCTTNSQCLSTYCVSGKCDKGLAGQTCNNRNDCFSKSCNNKKCKSLGEYQANTEIRTKGQECKVNTDCDSGQTNKDSPYHLKCNGATANKLGICGLTSSQVCRNVANTVKDPSYCLSGKCSSGDNGKCQRSPENGPCGQNSNCASGFVCGINNRCQKSCARDSDCDSQHLCDGQKCVSTCNVNSDCMSQYLECKSVNGKKRCTPSSATTATTPGIAMQQAQTQSQGQLKADGETCTNNNECSSNKCSNIYGGTEYQEGTPLLKNKICLRSGQSCGSWASCPTGQGCFATSSTKNSPKKCYNDYRKFSEIGCSNSKPCAAGETCISPIFGMGVKYCMRLGCTSSQDCSTPPFNDVTNPPQSQVGLKVSLYCKATTFMGSPVNVCDGNLAKNLVCNTNSDCPGIGHVCQMVGDKKMCVVSGVQQDNNDNLNEEPENDDENSRLEKWRAAIERALQNAQSRITNSIRAHEDVEVTGLAISGLRPGISDVFQRTQARVQQPEQEAQQQEEPVQARTVAEWKTELSALDASAQQVEGLICSEHSRHPEIEIEGLPCTQPEIQGALKKSIWATVLPRGIR